MSCSELAVREGDLPGVDRDLPVDRLVAPARSVERTKPVAYATDRFERGGAIAHLPSQPADYRLDDV